MRTMKCGLTVMVVMAMVGDVFSDHAKPQIWVELDRAVYPRYAPVSLRVWTEGTLTPPCTGAGATEADSPPADGPILPCWTVSMLLMPPDSLVVFVPAGIEPEDTNVIHGGSERRVIARGGVGKCWWLRPYRDGKKDMWPLGMIFEFVGIRSLDEALTAWPETYQEFPVGLGGHRPSLWFGRGSISWYPLEPDSANEMTLHTRSGILTRPPRCLTEYVGNHRLQVILTPREGERTLLPVAEFRVERPTGADSVAAELFRRSEILETAFGYSGGVSERAVETASMIVEQYRESPYVPYCRYVRGQWLYRLAELTAARHENGKVLVSVEDGHLMRPFTPRDSTAFAEARAEFERVLEHPEDIRAITETARRRIAWSYLNEGRGREAAEAFVKLGIGEKVLRALESTVTQRRSQPDIPFYMDFEARVRGTEECVHALRELLGEG